MATKGTFHQKCGDIGLIDWMLADAVNKFSGVGGNSSFCVVINALEHYREALVNDVEYVDPMSTCYDPKNCLHLPGNRTDRCQGKVHNG